MSYENLRAGDLVAYEGGKVHMVVRLLLASGRLPEDPNGLTACGQVFDPCTNRSEWHGHAGLDYRGEWLTCTKCRTALKRRT